MSALPLVIAVATLFAFAACSHEVAPAAEAAAGSSSGGTSAGSGGAAARAGAAGTGGSPVGSCGSAELAERPLSEAQELLDLAAPGSVVTFPPAIYVAPPHGPDGEGLLVHQTITVDGGGSVIRGTGFDESKTSLSGKYALVRVSANGASLKNLTIEQSPNLGIVLTGTQSSLEEVLVRDCWRNCIEIAGADDTTLRYVEAHNSRHGSGVAISPGNDGARLNLFQRIISHDHGRRPDGSRVAGIPGDPAGGGNSDGSGASKDCADAFETNPCADNRWIENILYDNVDDGLDVSVADATIRGNIAWHNGPAGGVGYKMLRPGTAFFAGNVAVGHDRGFEVRALEPVRFVHNLALESADWGFTFSGIVEATANVSHQNEKSMSCGSGCTQSSNFGAGDPKLADLGFQPPLWRYDYPACTVAERWALLYSAFRAAYVPDLDSPLVDAAVVSADYHCAPSGAGDGTCVEWHGAAPDLGPFESGD